MRGSYRDALAFDFKGIQKIHAKRCDAAKSCRFFAMVGKYVGN